LVDPQRSVSTRAPLFALAVTSARRVSSRSAPCAVKSRRPAPSRQCRVGGPRRELRRANGRGLEHRSQLVALGHATRVDRGAPALSKPRPFALVPLDCSSLSCDTTVILAGRRDLGAGTLADRSTIAKVRPVQRHPSAFFSISHERHSRPGQSRLSPMASFLAHRQVGRKIITSLARPAPCLFAPGCLGADAYLSVALLIMAVAVSFVAVTQAGATRRVSRVDNSTTSSMAPYSRLVAE